MQKECGNLAWSIIDKVLKDTTKTLIPSCAFVPPPEKTNVVGEKVQMSIANRSAYSLNEALKEDSLKAQINSTPATKYNGQLGNQTANGNVQGSSEPQRANGAFSFELNHLLHLLVLLLFLHASDSI